MTFEEAEVRIGKGRTVKNGYEACRLERNTYLVRLSPETIGVLYHNTFVVKIYQDGTYMLHSGGWQTATTKARMNDYSPARVFQQRGVWYVWSKDGKEHEFVDGIQVDSEGNVLIASTGTRVSA